MPITIGTSPQYQEQERIQAPNPRQLPMAQAPQGAPLPNLTPDTRPQQFMMANGLASVRDALQAVVLTKRHDENTAFLADMSTIQRAAMEQQDAYRQAKQGQDALTAGQDFETMMNQSFRPYQDKYKDNPRIATALEQKRQELSLAAFGAGSRYAGQQRDIWHKETLDGAVAGWKAALAGGDDAAIHQSWELLDATLATTMPGHDTDAIKQKLLQEGAAITLDRRIATKDYAGFQRDLGNFSSPAAAGATRGVKGLPPGQPYRFGDIIGQTESGNNYGSVTPLDVNGASYGKYQFHAGASLTDFLKQSSFGKELRAAGAPGSAGFGAKWKQLADNPQFQNEQDTFAKSYFLDRPLKASGSTWILDRSPAVQEAVMHTFAAAPTVGQRFVADINAAGGNSLSDEQILDVIENRYKTKIRDDWPTAIGKAERGEPGGVSAATLQRTKADEMAQFRDALANQGGGLLAGKQAMWRQRMRASIASDIQQQADVGNIDRARALLAQNGQYLADDDQRSALSAFVENAAQQKVRRDEAAQQQQYKQDWNSLLGMIVDPGSNIHSMADLYANKDAVSALEKAQAVHPEAVGNVRSFIAQNNQQAYPVQSPETDRLRDAMVGMSLNDPSAFAAMDLNRYVTQLPRNDLQSLLQAQMQLTSQKHILQEANVNKVLASVPAKELQRAGFDKNGKTSEKIDKYNQLVGQVFTATQDFVERNKRSPSMQESQDMVRSLLIKGSVNSGHWLQPNKSMTSSDALMQGQTAWQPDIGKLSNTEKTAYQQAWTDFAQRAGTAIPLSDDILRGLLRAKALPQTVPDAARSAIIKAFRAARGQDYQPTNQEIALVYTYAKARHSLPPQQGNAQ